MEELSKEELTALKKIYRYLERDALIFFDRAQDAFATCSLVDYNSKEIQIHLNYGKQNKNFEETHIVNRKNMSLIK
jgi:hypothetical protein